MNSHSLAERINREVNASVTYKTDLEQYDTPEFWKEASAFGDCVSSLSVKALRLMLGS